MNETSHPSAPDSALIARAQRGEAEAFGELYERYLDPIYRYLYSWAGNSGDAEDLTETVFLRASQALQRALTALPPDYGEVIRLRLLLGLPTGTVAAWMGRSQGAARILLFRALKALRQRLTDEHGSH